MIKPRTLRRGDRIAAISLSRGWPSVYPRAYQDGKRQLQEAFGVEVVETRHALADIDWLAAHPEARAADLVEVLKDPTIQGIVSTIGGDDSIRMLPFLDYSVIRENPKVFLGYSDSTITHFAFLKAGVTSFYGRRSWRVSMKTADCRATWRDPYTRCSSRLRHRCSFLPTRMDGRSSPGSGEMKIGMQGDEGFNPARVGNGCRAADGIGNVDRRVPRGRGLAPGHEGLARAGTVARQHIVHRDVRGTAVTTVRDMDASFNGRDRSAKQRPGNTLRPTMWPRGNISRLR